MGTLAKQDKYILLDNLFNLFLDVKYQEEDEEEMKSSNIDIEKIVQKNLVLFRQLRTQAKAELNQAKHSRAISLLNKITEGIKSNVAEYQKIADEIFSAPKFAQLQPMFRNFNEISDQDKRSILLDSKLLDFLSEIEEKYGDEHNTIE